MDKFKLFLIEYICVLIVFLIFNSFTILDSVIFVIFIISAIFYVFAFQELPSSKVPETPSVQYYRESKINTYGYVMAVILIATSLLFFVLNIVLGLRTGISTIVVWPITLLLIHFFSDKSQKDLLEKIISNFITKNLDSSEHIDTLGMVKFLIGKLKKHNVSDSKLESLLVNEFKISKELSESFVELS